MRFCGACGAALVAVEQPVRERRLVSVLFCDLVGFTTFSEERDHEDVRDTLDEYFGAARRVVDSYGGTIEKFIGDAVMAVWGAPVAREDDAERAVRAGLDVAAAVAGLADRLALPELRLRVGILTGEAAVDILNVSEGMVIGDAVNTAARIQSIAAPGEVLVEDITRLATARSIDYEDAGTHEVKGRSKPVHVWRATCVVPRRGGSGHTVPVEPPLVGRDAELATLRGSIGRLLAPGAGLELVMITGEAGLGKSRLAWELRRHADELGSLVRWLSGGVLAFGEGGGFSAVAEMIRTAARIGPQDSPDRQRDVIETWLDGLLPAPSPDRVRAARAVHRLLELDDGSELIEPGPLFSAWRMVLEREANRTPTVLVFEELDRAESALLAFIRHLREWGASTPILILALGRPGPWLDPLAALGERIVLRPLSDEHMDQLVAGAVHEASAPLLRLIRADAGGVPLFAVEALRALAQNDVLAVQHGQYVVTGPLGELALAPTIRALVASRLDALGQLERRSLAGGAVLGERFPAAGAAAVAGLAPADAVDLLDGLVIKAILHSEPAFAAPSYGFLQGVVRRVLLSMLARRERRRLHLAAVTHLLAGPPMPELAAQLAGHLVAAEQADPGNPDSAELRRRAARTLREAAERESSVGALEEAVALLDRAADLTEDERERATIFEQAGAVAQRAGTPEVAADRYRRAGEHHGAAGRWRQRSAARAHELRALRYVRAPGELLDELRELDAALDDRSDAASALAGSVLAFTLYQCGEPAEALSVATRAAAIADACGASAELVMALGARAAALGELERPEEAIEVYRRALAHVAGREERLMATLGGNLALALGSLGRYAESVQQAREALAAAERGADRFFARWNRLVIARSRCSLGEWDEAVAEIETVLDQVPPFQLGMAVGPLVVIALGRRQGQRATDLVADYDRRCSEPGASEFESDFRILRACALAVAAGDDHALARIVPQAEMSDYAEWTGWLATVVDHLVRLGSDDPLATALTALRGPGRMKRTAPVQAQAERLAANLASRAGDGEGAAAAWERAGALALSCGMRHDAQVIARERTRARER